jgi:hypothetical protein
MIVRTGVRCVGVGGWGRGVVVLPESGAFRDKAEHHNSQDSPAQRIFGTEDHVKQSKPGSDRQRLHAFSHIWKIDPKVNVYISTDMIRYT